MKFIDKLERKFGKYAIPDLIRYVMVVYVAGAVLGLYDSTQSVGIYDTFLALDYNKVFRGQIWRLFTFLIEPYGLTATGGIVFQILFLLIQVNLFMLFGRSLERAWGTFRFNLYMIAGWFFNVLAGLILYLSPAHVSVYASGFQYIYWAMFFAFAAVNPNLQLMLWFLIPIKVKWLAMLDGVYLGYMVIRYLYYAVLFRGTSYSAVFISGAVAILVALANFLIFFFTTRDYRRVSPKEIHRKQEFRRKMRQGQPGKGARHRCAICGRTELDDPTLEFRYCSKCEGNYEYCTDHLYTHQHVKKSDQ